MHLWAKIHNPGTTELPGSFAASLTMGRETVSSAIFLLRIPSWLPSRKFLFLKTLKSLCLYHLQITQLGLFISPQFYRCIIDKIICIWGVQHDDLIVNILWNGYHNQVDYHIHHLTLLSLYVWMRTYKLYSLSKFQVYEYSIINHRYHAVPCIPRTYLAYNWNFVHFDQPPIATPAPGNHHSFPSHPGNHHSISSGVQAF